MSRSFKTIAITMGDPLGIGPEIICRSLLAQDLHAHFIIVGVRAVFERLAFFKEIEDRSAISFVDVAKMPEDRMTAREAALLSFRSLECAVDLIRDKKADALVTAPVSKQRISEAGIDFVGHTEYLCKFFHVQRYAMMLFHDTLKVVLLSTHQPLRDIFREVTVEHICEKLDLTERVLRERFAIEHPRIAVCGLNPHAGDGGLFGDEEQRVIIPAIERFRKSRMGNTACTLFGPQAPDSVFWQAIQGCYDAVLCLYHDQGLIAVKTTGFDKTVNMTVGLPFVRTSPDHGPAYDLAGTGTANPLSMIKAIEVAERLV